jgi:hypothetical protein
MPTRVVRVLAVFVFASAVCSPAQGASLFSDDFDSGASPVWGNESGGWYAAGGVYRAASPTNNPMTYSSVTSLPNLSDFIVDADVKGWRDGGIYLRSSRSGSVTGGSHGSYAGLYWHTIQNGGFSAALGAAPIPGILGSDAHLTLKVAGDRYEAWVNGQFKSALETTAFTQGRVAVYQFAATQALDNFQVSAIPEPGICAMMAAGLGLLGFSSYRRRQAIA